MSQCNQGIIKQYVSARRKPGLSREEYFEYHFKVHGALSLGPTKDASPSKYFQTQFFDTVYHAANLGQPGPPNFNHPWAFHDDSTELYFGSIGHLASCYGDEHVRTKVGPDGLNFSDLGAVIGHFCREYDVEGLPGHQSPQSAAVPEEGLVTQVWVQGISDEEDGSKSLQSLEPLLIDAVQKFAAAEVTRVVANPTMPDTLNLLRYFGSPGDVPKYSGVFTVFFHNLTGIPSLRKAQRFFFEEADKKGLLRTKCSFVTFGQRALVFDLEKDIPFEAQRRPASAYPSPS